MTKLEALELAVKENNRLKRIIGYQYGKTDCVTLFTIYNDYSSTNTPIRGKIKDYKTPRTFHNRVKALGYTDCFDLLRKIGYYEVEIDSAQPGDICVFNSPVGDFTISIFNGEVWVNSSNVPKYEQLSTDYVRDKVMFVGRLAEEYYAGT